MSGAKPAAAYHHGALRNALLRAGEEVLAERGVSGFTLRECARRAGVSHAAPAHHFGDAAGFLAELAAVGFDRMTASMNAARAAAAPTPQAGLQAIGRGYIAFAVRNRALFQIMFRHDAEGWESANLRRAGAAAFAVLQDAMQAMLAGRRQPVALGPALALAWSTVHGFATLLIEGQIQGCAALEGMADAEADLGDATLALMLRALVPIDTRP